MGLEMLSEVQLGPWHPPPLPDQGGHVAAAEPSPFSAEGQVVTTLAGSEVMIQGFDTVRQS